MSRRLLSKIVVFSLLTFILFCMVASGGVFWMIRKTVREYAAEAQKTCPHPGDDLAALIESFQSDAVDIRQRNHAIWALGRLSDRRALLALQAAYTGGRCEHDKYPCQHELEKAIKRCGGKALPPRLAQVP